ncbi:hypothetical protein [Sideroxydans lithotrophicus]|uniref:Uncharacterized protein n=1 Tax=Sideroxydans lithotrophicus (strain ES-1) TaxID=580332 RepID=D5CN56_SIDLE|nr:hypothetical protein [Sideroxydans lithotrophicus]ADE12753.1 conserved hypothetical protein [Sideroxydans lithotrophicus ES-1]
MKIGLIAVFGLLAINAGKAIAGPADYVYTPTVEYGEREVDFKYGSFRQKDGTLAQGASIGVGYGATEYWFTEIYLKQEQIGGQIANLAEWENKFQLTETGRYPVDAGLVTELEAPLSSNAPWELKLGPLLQTEFGNLQLNGNLLFERAFGKADESGVPYSTNFSYQWQAKYRWQPVLEFGLQGFGEMGKWNDWNRQADQVHRIGPAVFGKLGLGGRQAIRYNAAWLSGVSSAAPRHTFRMQVEYEF